jgi:hypothetical protein
MTEHEIRADERRRILAVRYVTGQTPAPSPDAPPDTTNEES